jgi:hypothetical protein
VGSNPTPSANMSRKSELRFFGPSDAEIALWKQYSKVFGVAKAAQEMQKRGHPIQDALVVLLGYGKFPTQVIDWSKLERT